ncbi:hypothetical protein [Nitrosopumilus sp.]|uniref:hypothetical protein n=1 Tax=Nitrosopumilus sp. TaxID=2024843 RepID=UPI003D0B4E19
MPFQQTVTKIFRSGKRAIDKALPKKINSQYLLAENREEMNRLKKDICAKVVVYARENLKEGDKNFTGELSESIEVVVQDNNVSVVVKSPYGWPVEFGLTPGRTVNFDALRNWVEGKLGVPHSESYEVTLKIANKIKSKGIKPTRFFKKAILRLVKADGARVSGNRKKTSKFKKIMKILKRINRIRKKVSKFISMKGKMKS